VPKFNYNPRQPQKAAIFRPRKKPRFRWVFVLVPGTILLAMWFASGITVGFSWPSVMDALKVHNRERYTNLACLGLACVAVVAIARILRKDNDKSEEK